MSFNVKLLIQFVNLPKGTGCVLKSGVAREKAAHLWSKWMDTSLHSISYIAFVTIWSVPVYITL